MESTHTRQSIERRASARAQARKRRTRLNLGTQVFVVLLLLSLVDYWVPIDPPYRLILTVIFVGLSLRLLMGARGRLRRDAIRTYVNEVERATEDRGLLLRTAASETARARTPRDAIGDYLLDRLDSEANAVMERDPTEVDRTEARSRFAFRAVAALVLLFTLSGGGLSLIRLLNPISDLSYTRVRLSSPESPLPAGRPMVVQGRVSGRRTGEVTLVLAATGERFTGVVGKRGRFEVEIPLLRKSTLVRGYAGDGRSEAILLKTYTLPSVERHRIEVAPPDYARRLTKVVNSPSFEVLRGSAVTYDLVTKGDLETASMSIVNADEETPSLLPWEPDGVDRYRLELNDLRQTWDYRIQLTGSRGDRVENEEPYQLLVMEDSPPRIEITSHSGDEFQLGDPLRLELRGIDDVGIERLRVLFRKVGDPELEQEIRFDRESPHEFYTRADIDLDRLNLRPFDLVAVHAEATDGNTLDGPGVGESEVLLIEVPAPDSDLAGGGGGGGGGGAQVNPLEMQKYIFMDTSRLGPNPSESVLQAIRSEQEEAAGYVEELRAQAMGASDNPIAVEFAVELRLALAVMNLSARKLIPFERRQALKAQELAIATLSRAAALLPEGEPPPGGGEGQGGMQITLRGASSSSEGAEGREETQEQLQDLLAQIEAAIAAQEEMNAALANSSDPTEASANSPSAESQAQLGTQSAQMASTAGSIAPVAGASASPGQVASQLNQAAENQGDAADSIASSDFAGGLLAGVAGEAALGEAAELIQGMLDRLDQAMTQTVDAPPGYAYLVENYLKAISYEDGSDE